MPNAVIYARYSSHAQRDVSIDQQVDACMAFARRGSIDVVGTYADRAISGTSDRRPAFQRMIADAKTGGWQYVIVYTLDRFARDRYDSAIYKRQLRNCGVKVLSAMEQITDDPTGVLMESILEGYAEYYSKELSRKVRRGHEDNAKKCMPNGPMPLGYKRGEDGRYAIDEPRAEIVREIYRRVGAGEPLVKIIDDFNARGLRTMRGHPWNRSSFGQILSNERYAGVYMYQDIRIPDGIPAIIPRAEFDAVQHYITHKRQPRQSLAAGVEQPRRQRRDVYLLTGKLFCGECDNALVGVSGTSKNGTVHNYYRCNGHASGCGLKNLRRDTAEREIAQALKKYVLSDEGIAYLAQASYEQQLAERSSPDLELLSQELRETERAVTNIMAAIEQGIFTITTRDRLQELENRKAVLQSQITAAKSQQEEIISAEEIAAVLRHYADGDINDKSYQEALIDVFLVRAYVYPDHYRIYFTTDPEKSVDFPSDSVRTDSTKSGQHDPNLRYLSGAQRCREPS